MATKFVTSEALISLGFTKLNDRLYTLDGLKVLLGKELMTVEYLKSVYFKRTGKQLKTKIKEQ